MLTLPCQSTAEPPLLHFSIRDNWDYVNYCQSRQYSLRWLIAIRSAINYEDDQVFCTKSCNGQVFGHFSVALSYATHPYCTRVVKILLFQNAPGQTPVSQIAKLSAKAKGQEKRYIVSMSGANLSFLLGKVSVLTCYFFSIACGNRCGFKTISLAGIRAMLNPSKRVLGSMNWAIS